jgi:hypothetical protein
MVCVCACGHIEAVEDVVMMNGKKYCKWCKDKEFINQDSREVQKTKVPGSSLYTVGGK